MRHKLFNMLIWAENVIFISQSCKMQENPGAVFNLLLCLKTYRKTQV